MMFPVKSHLPLITTRIEFQLNKLPPPPQITSRRDLGTHLRRQGRRNAVPYSRHLRSMSPLSGLSNSGNSSDEENSDATKIPKPKAEAGRSNSGGYNLKEVLGWEEERYSKFTVSCIMPN